MEKHPITPCVAELSPSATIAINLKSNELLKEGKQVYKLGLGQSPFPVHDSIVAALKEHAHEKDYLHVQGLLALREAVASFHKRKDNLAITPQGVLIGPGSKELLFILALVFDGSIFLPNPSWVSYNTQAKINNRKVIWIDTNFEEKWKIDPAKLDEAFVNTPGAKLLILNYPSNPHGQTYDNDHLKVIADVAKKHGAIILSDEIYGHLTYAKNHVSIATHYPEGTILLGGLSKWCGAGGWRLGTFSFPPELDWLKKAMVAVASETFSSVSAPIQHAAIVAFSGSEEIDRYVHDECRILDALGKECANRLAKVGVDVHPPQGGFYIFPDFSPYAQNLKSKGIPNEVEFCKRLLEETGVAIIPGSCFGRPEDEFTARMSLVNFDGAHALDVAKSIPANDLLPLSIIEECCAPTLEAMDKITAWLQQYT